MKQLDSDDLRELGWEKKEVESYGGKVITYFSKDNYYLTFKKRTDDYVIINLFIVDSSKIYDIPDPEHIRIVLRCPSVDHFKVIETMLI